VNCDFPVARQLRIGTRGSQLALVQARTVAALLLDRCGVPCEIVEIKTSGDRLVDVSLSAAGGKGLFVKEIEDALLTGSVDIAVHSSKDMPAALPAGLTLAATLARENPGDALVLRAGTAAASWSEALNLLGPAPAIGTSSVRRVAQLRRTIHGASFQAMRGNVDTRLRKLDHGAEVSGLVLAAAGLRRLGLESRISAVVPLEVSVPAPGQGTVAIEARAADTPLLDTLRQIGDSVSMTTLVAERAVVSRLGGGCQMPIGAFASVAGDTMTMKCIVVSPDGARAARAEVFGPSDRAAGIGVEAAERLLAAGADEILAALR
jgi:hydroxymethylbilane synthase